MADRSPAAHVHEWERGRHMAEAFGVDGRKAACAICGIVRECFPTGDLWHCSVHGGYWPRAARYCDAQEGVR